MQNPTLCQNRRSDRFASGASAVGAAVPCPTNRTYAVPHSNACSPAPAWYLSFYLLFVSSLCERRNEQQKDDTVPLINPAFIDELLDMLVQGSYRAFARLRTMVEGVFSQFESLFESLGVELYDRDIDPNSA